MRATLREQRAGGWGTLHFRERAAEGGQRPSSVYENDFQQKKAPNAIAAFSFRRTREFGREDIIMALIERVFIAMAVSGFLGLIATLAWMMAEVG
jgi:hypothetical protein